MIPDAKRFYRGDGGGNRLAKSDVLMFLDKVFGDKAEADQMIYPEWGLGGTTEGWKLYLARLFTWARGGEARYQAGLAFSIGRTLKADEEDILVFFWSVPQYLF